jgi:glycosyltransferase involved in cell wall biosynthesis
MDRPPESYRRLTTFVERLARGHREVWLLSSRPSARLLFDLYPWDRVITDIEDPWLDLSWGRSLDQRDTHRLFELSDVIVANGPFLARASADHFNTTVRSLPNGIDEQFVKKLDYSCPRPSWLRVPEGSLSAVYTGNFNDRIDLQWLWDVANSCPKIEFFLVGPHNLPATSMAAWRRTCERSNVHYIGRLPHAQMPAVLSHADVLLLPYLQNGATTMFPAKLYEYMAAARPVVSTVDYAKAGVAWPLFRYAPDTLAMIAALEEILAGRWSVSEDDRRVSRQIARENTWERRVEDFLQIVQNAPRKRLASLVFSPESRLGHVKSSVVKHYPA